MRSIQAWENNPRNQHTINGRQEQQAKVRDICTNMKTTLTAPRDKRRTMRYNALLGWVEVM